MLGLILIVGLGYGCLLLVVIAYCSCYAGWIGLLAWLLLCYYVAAFVFRFPTGCMCCLYCVCVCFRLWVCLGLGRLV